MGARKPVDAKATASMVVLCAIWGLQQVAMKAAAPDMAPVLQVAIRSGAAALPVGLLMLIRREGWALQGGTWKPGLAAGGLLAMEFLFVGEGLRFTTASHMVIFLYTAPVFAALGLHSRLAEERLRAGQWCGVALAFAGIAVAFVGRDAGAARNSHLQWLGDLMGVAAGISWAAETLTIRFSRLSNTPATVTLFYQLLAASGLLLVAAMALHQTGMKVSPLLLGSLGFQILLVSVLSFLVWFALLRTYLASRLGVLSFLTPVFGVAFGVTILGDRLNGGFVTGVLMILAGITLVSARDLFPGRAPPALQTAEASTGRSDPA